MIQPVSVVGVNVLEEMARICAATPPGCFVEFGVYQGGSAWYLAQVAEAQGRELYLYDTFTGIPFKSEFDSHVPGDFGDTSEERVAEAIPYAKIIKGVFPDSLVDMPPIAFVHVDADQYESYKSALAVFVPRMVPGGLMIFDDYCLAGASRALDESGLKMEQTENSKMMVRF